MIIPIRTFNESIYSNCDMTASSPTSLAEPKPFNSNKQSGWKMVLDVFPYTGDMSNTDYQYYVGGVTYNSSGSSDYPFYVYYYKPTNKLSFRWFNGTTLSVDAKLNTWNRITLANYSITNETNGAYSSDTKKAMTGGLSVAKIFSDNNSLGFIKEAWMYNSSNTLKYHYYWADDGTTMTFGGSFTVISTTNKNIIYKPYKTVFGAWYNNRPLHSLVYQNDICNFKYLLRASSRGTGSYSYTSIQIMKKNIKLHDYSTMQTGNFKIQVGLINYFESAYNYNTQYLFKVLQFDLNSGNAGLSMGGGSGYVIYRAYAKDSTLPNETLTKAVGTYREFELTQNKLTDLVSGTYVDSTNKRNYIPQYIYIYPYMSGNYIGYCDVAYDYIKIWVNGVMKYDYHATKINGEYVLEDRLNSDNNIVINSTNTNYVSRYSGIWSK